VTAVETRGARGGAAAAGEPRLADSVARLSAWLEVHDYRAYDPFDGLNAWLRPLAVTSLARRVLQQGVRRLPVNVRPALGITPATSTKGAGYIARAHLRLYRLGGEREHLAVAEGCLAWLVDAATPGYAGLCWGNHFDYQSRVFYLPRGEPTVVWTAVIGHAFLDAWEVSGREVYLEAARSVVRFILEDLERRPAGDGLCISYIPSAFKDVHNANMLAASVLARTAAATGDGQAAEVAAGAVAYTAGRQRADGSWWYGEARDLHWVDNFHTGYVLDSLWWFMRATGDEERRPAFERGARFFVEHFFLADGTPRYYWDRTWPVDIQCCAQAIETLVLLAADRDDAGMLALARRVAAWTIANMQDADGHFYFQRWPLVVNRTAMFHWGQATMLHALATLLEREARP
jgi:hypothetical protein